MVAEFDLSAFEGSSRHSCSETSSFQLRFFKGGGHVDLSIWKISPSGSFNGLPSNPEFGQFLLLFSYHKSPRWAMVTSGHNRHWPAHSMVQE